jgi:hypothetical protein
MRLEKIAVKHAQSSSFGNRTANNDTQLDSLLRPLWKKSSELGRDGTWRNTGVGNYELGNCQGRPKPRYSPFVSSPPFHGPGRRTADLYTHDALREFKSEELCLERLDYHCIYPAIQWNLGTLADSHPLRLHLVSILDSLAMLLRIGRLSLCYVLITCRFYDQVDG